MGRTLGASVWRLSCTDGSHQSAGRERMGGLAPETFTCVFSKQLCKACGVSGTAPSGLGTQQGTKQMQSWPSESFLDHIEEFDISYVGW